MSVNITADSSKIQQISAMRSQMPAALIICSTCLIAFSTADTTNAMGCQHHRSRPSWTDRPRAREPQQMRHALIGGRNYERRHRTCLEHALASNSVVNSLKGATHTPHFLHDSSPLVVLCARNAYYSIRQSCPCCKMRTSSSSLLRSSFR